MAGTLATRLALMFPESTEQLALVNLIGVEDWKALGVPYRTVDENYAAELRTTPESIREYERLSYFGGQWKPDYDALIEIPAGWSKDPDFPIVAWDSALTSDMNFTPPVLCEFPLVTSRTLFIIGQRDRTAFAGLGFRRTCATGSATTPWGPEPRREPFPTPSGWRSPATGICRRSRHSTNTPKRCWDCDLG
jgi:pimeloyl-ACP methyl ester carboxylesterase